MTMEKKAQIDIGELKNDIEHHTNLKSRFVKESNYMLFLISISIICFVYGLCVSKFIFSSLILIVGFLCIRRYNICIDKAEVHSGIIRFLKALLVQEQTGEDVFKKIVG